jgi:DNA-binding LacI/PurR family transcriptional regulator
LALTANVEVNSSVSRRAEGYYQALRDYGLDGDDGLVLEGLASRQRIVEPAAEEGRQKDANIERLQEFLERERPSAVFAVNDLIAIDTWQAAERCGLSVPGDVCIVGFDDADFLRDLGIDLTTVAQDAFQVGREAVNILTECIEGRIGVARQIVLPTDLVIRGSCQACSAG